MAPIPILQAATKKIAAEADLVVSVLRDKGSKRFSRALGLAGIFVGIAYVAFLMPAQSKMQRLDEQIAQAKIAYDYGTQYKTLHDSLSAAYARLPTITDRPQWLTSSVRALLDAGRLESDSFELPQETEHEGLIFQESTVTFSADFRSIFSFLLRAENARPMMHIRHLSITKSTNFDPDHPGMAQVTCVISTVIASKRY